ncbi:MAG: DUF167 domain-containing protein [Candidatus Thalassarchaeaceae archaeon]
MEPNWARESEGYTLVEIDVQPSSKRSEIIGLEPWRGRLKIAVRSPPVDGAANVELMELLAREIGMKKTDISIVVGHSKRRKTIKLRGNKIAIIQKLIED